MASEFDEKIEQLFREQKAEADKGNKEAAQFLLKMAAEQLEAGSLYEPSLIAFLADCITDVVKHDDGLLIINPKGRRGVPRRLHRTPDIERKIEELFNVPTSALPNKGGRPRNQTVEQEREMLEIYEKSRADASRHFRRKIKDKEMMGFILNGSPELGFNGLGYESAHSLKSDVDRCRKAISRMRVRARKSQSQNPTEK